MENVLVKEMPAEVTERNAAMVESEFELDIRVFTLVSQGDTKGPQVSATDALCSFTYSLTCPGVNSCFTCFFC